MYGGLSLNTSQTTHETNDHGRYASIVTEKRIVFKENFTSLNCFMNPVVKVFLKCVIRIFTDFFRWSAFPTFCTHIFLPLALSIRVFA